MSWREKITDPLVRFCKNHPAIFFFQERVGVRGDIFEIIKFKTFYDEVPANHKHHKSESLRAQIRGHYDEARLNPNRKWMRKIKIDELPQLINLIRGDLQLVGSRALPVEEFPTFPKDIQEKYKKNKPGLIPGEQQFNWWSKEGRYSSYGLFLTDLENNRNPRSFKIRSGIRAFINSFSHPANG